MNKQYSMILGLSLLVGPLVVSAEIHESEQQALRALYNATSGDNWFVNDGWSSDGQINCDAYGITCTPYSDYFPVRPETWKTVVGLSLPENNLDGVLPSEISQLEYLWDLDLESNQLAGRIPNNFSVRLTINLSDNAFTGELPASLWHGHVYNLDLSNNALSGEIPPELGVLGSTARTDLKNIDLSNNGFSGPIPAELGDLAWRGGSGKLDLSYNQLSGPMPVELGEMENPRFIYIDHNALSGSIPGDVLSGWKSVCQLKLGFNRFTGEVPASINQMISLNQSGEAALDLSFNALHSTDETTIAFINQHSGDAVFPETQVRDVSTLLLDSVNDNSVDLSWGVTDTRPSTEGGYRIYLSQTISGPFELASDLAGRETVTARLEILQPQTDYWAKVSSYTVVDDALYNAEIDDYSIESDGENAKVVSFTTKMVSEDPDNGSSDGGGSGFASAILLLFTAWFRKSAKLRQV